MAMKTEAPSKSPSWTARSLRPVVAAYVALVFCAFIAVAYFVLHSTKAVTALVTTGFGSVIALVPTMLARSEYQLTEAGVAKRLVSRNRTRRFEEIFRWEDLSHLVPTSTGFKYFKKLVERRPIARFFKLHFSNNYSGEIHVEDKDRSLVRALLLERGVRLSGRPARDRLPALRAWVISVRRGWSGPERTRSVSGRPASDAAARGGSPPARVPRPRGPRQDSESSSRSGAGPAGDR